MNTHNRDISGGGLLWYLIFVVAFLAVVTPLTVMRQSTTKTAKRTAGTIQQKVQVKVRKIVEAPAPPPQVRVTPPAPVPPPQQLAIAKVAAESPTRKTDNQNGTALAISAGYRQHLGWSGYLREMARLGGVFYLFDPFYEKIKAQIDFQPLQFKEVDVHLVKRMSPRIREISGEIAVSDLLVQARQRFGPGRYAVILLLPQDLDGRIQAEAINGLQGNNLKSIEVVRVNGEYQAAGGGLELQVFEAVKRDGSTVPVRFVVRL
jgi:hypothetical protein